MIARRLAKLEAAIGTMTAAPPCPSCLGRNGKDGMTHIINPWAPEPSPYGEDGRCTRCGGEPRDRLYFEVMAGTGPEFEKLRELQTRFGFVSTV